MRENLPVETHSPGGCRSSVNFSLLQDSVLERTVYMVKRIAFLVLFLFGGLMVPAVRADEQTGRPLVVVVGIDKYQDSQIKPRQHAEADAKALAELFLSKERLGVD